MKSKLAIGGTATRNTLLKLLSQPDALILTLKSKMILLSNILAVVVNLIKPGPEEEGGVKLKPVKGIPLASANALIEGIDQPEP